MIGISNILEYSNDKLDKMSCVKFTRFVLTKIIILLNLNVRFKQSLNENATNRS